MMENVNKEECFHGYIVCLGEDKETNETYDYCLTCGQRIKGLATQAFYVNATFYLEEYPIETEIGRSQKVRALRNEFNEFMLKNGGVSPEYIIDDFRDMVEYKRNQIYQVRGKVY